jgi:hypothetical protein
MPNRLTRDASGNLVPKINIDGLPDGIVVNADIADDSITNVKINSSAGITLGKLATDPLARANHTGSQTASTISDFDAVVGTSTSTLTNKTFDANGAGNSITNIENADLANSTIEAGKIDFFKSTETTGTGAEADIAHGLGRTPSLVIVVPTENTTGNTLDITEGIHDGTNVKVTAPATCKFVVYAL